MDFSCSVIDGKLQLKHVPAANKERHEEGTRCRDTCSKMAKSREKGRDNRKLFSIQPPYIYLSIMDVLWKGIPPPPPVFEIALQCNKLSI